MKKALWAVAAAVLCTGVSARAATLNEVLSTMDKGARTFTGVTAQVKRTSFTAVIDDKSDETGTFALKRKGSNVMMRIDFTAPHNRTVSFQGRKASIYYPKINTVQEYDLGKQRELVDQFLLLGFGTSGKQLSQNYKLKYTGDETVSGRGTHRLELTPKSRNVAEQVKRIELWIDPGTGQPMQQKFHQSGGDYTLIQYSNLELKPGLPDTAVALQLPANVKREYPQK
jgi:outer membrane lipoprotein-sorting protein